MADGWMDGGRHHQPTTSPNQDETFIHSDINKV